LEWKTLAVLAVIAAGLWTFAEVADAVLAGASREVDERILLAMRNPADPSDPLGPGWVEEAGRDLTALGSIVVLALVTGAAAGYLLLTAQRRALVLLLVSVVGGQVLSSLLKRGFDRPRPDLVPHETLVYSASFPSGHAMLSAVTYFTVGALIARVQPRRRVKLLILGWATALAVLTGASRVYLGVHWPTDVVAGWAVGASWAAGCWAVSERLARGAGRRPPDPPPEEAGPPRA
jgi:undecaprenyl-diphosphatase